MTHNSFSERYKSKTPLELMAIIADPDSYQPEAVEAARLELDSRLLPNDQLEAARSELNARAKEKDHKKRDKATIRRTIGESPSDILDPIQTTTSTVDRDIKLISFFLGGLFLYQLQGRLWVFSYIFSDPSELDVGLIEFTLPLVVLPASAVLFFLRKRWGWILAAFFSSGAAATAVEGLLFYLLTAPVEIMNLIISPVPPYIYVVSFVVHAGILWPLLKPKILDAYRIDKPVIYGAIGAGVVYILLVWFLFINI